MILARRSLTCVASSQKPQNSIAAARKAFEKRRTSSVKENFNKLVLIATSDTKEITDFMKELDELHKKQFESFKKKDESNEENVFLDESQQ